MNSPRNTTVRLQPQQALVALGANLPSTFGAPDQTVLAAQQALQELSVAPVINSSLYRSAPVDCPPGSPDFVNAVSLLTVAADLPPATLLASLQDLENRFGRRREGLVNAPRSLDLDLIGYGERRQRDRSLILPHPRAHQRRFVLAPLAELLPDLLLAGQERTVDELLAGLPRTAGDMPPGQ